MIELINFFKNVDRIEYDHNFYKYLNFYNEKNFIYGIKSSYLEILLEIDIEKHIKYD